MAERWNKSRRQVQYAVDQCRVVPADVIGVSHLYDQIAQQSIVVYLHEILSPSAVVLVPRTGPGSDVRTVLEIGRGSNPIRSPSGTEKVAGADWMMYRVVTTTLEPEDPATCFSVSHDVKPGEGISVIPMLHPDTWTPRWAFADARRARFEIRVTSAAGKRRIAFSEERSANAPASEVEVALSGFAGRSVEVEFCAFRWRSQGGASRRVRAGWAEPRVVRTVGR